MKNRKIKYLIVHHSVSSWGDGEVVKSWHTSPRPRGNGWKAPGYHAVICNGFPSYSSWSSRKPLTTADGRVDRIWPESKISNGCRYANANALHVCLIGDLDKNPPTEKQLRKLVDLLVFWCKKYGLDPLKDIYGHGEMQRKISREGYSKTCPGKMTDMECIRTRVTEILSRRNNESEVA